MQLKSHKTVEQIAKKHRMNVSDIRRQLDMGVPIEHEHTHNKTLATDIALQHLDEIPDYYTRLKKMEASAKKEHKKFKDVKEDAVTDLQRGITELPDASYGSIDSLMRRIMKKRKMTAKQLHNDFIDKHNQTPDTWAKKNMKEETGLWDNIHARREKGLPRKKPGQKGYPKTLKIEEGLKQARKNVGASKCWPGKVTKGTKIKNGKEVPNCVPVTEASEMKRYCPKCAKEETRNECKYGQKYWDMFSMPITLKDYTPNTPHPGNMPEETTIEDVNGNTFLRITDIIRADRLVKEEISPTIRGGKSQYINPSLPKENPEDVPIIIIKGKEPKLPLAKAKTKSNMQVAHYIPKTFGEFMSEANKSEMKCNSPKSEPVGDSLTGKSHVVKACENGKEKLLRFGQRGVKGSPKKKGESKAYASRRNRFQTRHAKNIAKGKMSAAFWSNKVKW
jgi:hypothetical protein